MCEDDKPCPKCDCMMSRGFLSGFPGSSAVLTAWCDGEPKRKRGFALDSVRIDPKDCVYLQAFRCAGCGYIEIYARAADSINTST
ncbi:hypothetical protein V7x_27790 [Crateriforma conspicua]|uniref:Uncharacterized protein n=1 Tax=Crateriforma conspicua TaxID=2527996 RepID=A0A5C6FXU2_9PLAN|nr:hypothetical protein V7x_27790 [Crateriforma conspicua]